MYARQRVRCSVAATLEVVGERWSLLIVREALMGSKRFDEFHDRIGVARNILAQRLKALVGHGVLKRQPSPENKRIPLYTLTPKGEDLLASVVSILQWGDRWIHDDVGAPIVLTERESSQALVPMRPTTKDGVTVTAKNLSIHAGPGATAVMRQRFAPTATRK
jgi:DNA-binding HxlR family transcriptional regulator